MRSFIRILSLVFVSAFSAFPALAEKIEPSGPTNPPPAEALSAFDRFEMRPITMESPYAEQNANKKAIKKVQKELDEKIAKLFADLNAHPANNDPPRRLLIEPRVTKIKFIGGGARFFAGAFAGKSAILMRMRLSDADSGAEIGDPEFYQHAGAWSGGMSVGGADNAMLSRAASIIVEYLENNYPQAVGGATSLVEEVKKE